MVHCWLAVLERTLSEVARRLKGRLCFPSGKIWGEGGRKEGEGGGEENRKEGGGGGVCTLKVQLSYVLLNFI